MSKKQNGRVKQDTPPTLDTATSAALEQQVLLNPVVQEAMRLFHARVTAITRTEADGAARSSEVEQPALFFSS